MRQAILPLFVAAALATAVAAAQTTPTNPSAQPSSDSSAPQMSSERQATQSNRENDARTRTSQQSQPGRKTHKSSASESAGAQGPQSKRSNDASPKQGQARTNPHNRASSETRPDARYAHPSGQDSEPDNSSHSTRLASGDSASTGRGTADNRGPKASDQSRPVRKLSERKTYTGSSGSKADPSTACSTARRTQDGGIDCGTSGNSATEGNIVTKPH
jgi:hypothetical protein